MSESKQTHIKIADESYVEPGKAHIKVLRRRNGQSVKQMRLVARGGELHLEKGASATIFEKTVTHTSDGFCRYETGPGIWEVTGAENNWGKQGATVLWAEKEGEVKEFSRDDLESMADFLGADFSSEIEAQRRQLPAIVQAIKNEREAYGHVERNGFIAKPEFRRIPEVDEIGEILRSDWFDNEFDNESEYIKHWAAKPVRYVVDSPIFAKGLTAEEAIESAAKKKASSEKAKAEAEEMALPELSGTPRQIAWALTIRGKFAKSNPDSPKLKKATTAKYWIENRNSL